MNLQNMSEIEDDVRLTLVNMSKWESMSEEERKMIVGPHYIDRPQMFRLNSGEKCNLKAAALISRKWLEDNSAVRGERGSAIQRNPRGQHSHLKCLEQPLATSAATSATAAATTSTATPATIAVAPPAIIFTAKISETTSETSSATTSQQPPQLSPRHGRMRTGLNSFYHIYSLYSMINCKYGK
jgi:hypothetical protein